MADDVPPNFAIDLHGPLADFIRAGLRASFPDDSAEEIDARLHAQLTAAHLGPGGAPAGGAGQQPLLEQPQDPPLPPPQQPPLPPPPQPQQPDLQPPAPEQLQPPPQLPPLAPFQAPPPSPRAAPPPVFAFPAVRRASPPPLPAAARSKVAWPQVDRSKRGLVRLTLLAAPVAYETLRKGKWINLWYFTREGYAFATAAYAEPISDALALTADASGHVQLATAAKTTRKALLDDALSWDHVMFAKVGLLEAMAQEGYPDDHLELWADTFLALEHHPSRHGPTGEIAESALILYLAYLRRDYHNKVQAGLPIGDLSEIDADILRTCRERVVEARYQQLSRYVLLIIPESHNLLTSSFHHHPPLRHIPALRSCVHAFSAFYAYPAFCPCVVCVRVYLAFPRNATSARLAPAARCFRHVPTSTCRVQDAFLAQELEPPRERSNRGRADCPRPTKRTRSSSPFDTDAPSRGRPRPTAPHPQAHVDTAGSYGGRRSYRAAPGTAGFLSLPVCAICLGRHEHDLKNCNASHRWDGQPADYRRLPNQRIVTFRGDLICTEWQRRGSCHSQDPRHRHECSGCGSRKHGAHDCHLAEGYSGTDPAEG